MAITSGTRLGPYEITGPLGAGGMGEVYRAHDTRLRRDVAIKVLPPAFAEDEDRLRRFEQEALATAALNHPNILVVYDVGKETQSAGAGSPLAYVVEELLEGRTLREVLADEQLPVRKVVDYAVQIANGLAAAHAKGLVHRDLKPENLFVTSDDRVKILDFGLAKVTEARPGAASTMLAVATEPGMVLGTIGYMAPEQVRGVTVDHRADLFSFGAILYELLAGRRAFGGETAADTMTAILKEAPPDLAESGRTLPPAIARVVDRCLEKSPALRFQSASDLAFALQTLGSDARSGSAIGPLPAAVAEARSGRAWLTAAAFVAAGAALAWGAFTILSSPPASDAAPLVLDVVPPPGHTAGATSALSPDGARLVFPAADASGRTQLWLRTLATGDLRAIAGTDDGRNPFWSPDGTNVGFFGDGRLRVVDLTADRVRVIADVTGMRTAGTWNSDDVILYASEGGVPIMKVEATGRSAPVPATSIVGFRPHFLPDGRHFLFHERSAGMRIGNIETGETELLRDGVDGQYAAGHLLFVEGQQLLAQPFDPVARTLSGEPAILADVGNYQGDVGPNVSVTDGGLLAFRRSPPASRQLVSYSRDGRRLGIVEGDGDWRNPAFSPDDSRIAVERDEGQGTAYDIWILDVARGTSRRLASERATERVPTWAAQDVVIYTRYARSQAPPQLVRKSLEGGPETVLVTGPIGFPTGLLPDGRSAVAFDLTRAANRDVFILPIEGDGERVTFAGSAFNETQPALSPDGRWLAYVSDEFGVNEARDVFVQAFPGGGRKVHVSVDTGGVQPRWRRDGRELFYVARDGRLTVVAANVAGDAISFGPPQPLFPTTSDFEPGLGTRAIYDVTRDGQRFIVAEVRNAIVDLPITVLVNWPAATRASNR